MYHVDHAERDRRPADTRLTVRVYPCVLWKLLIELYELVDIRAARCMVVHDRDTIVLHAERLRQLTLRLY